VDPANPFLQALNFCQDRGRQGPELQWRLLANRIAGSRGVLLRRI